MKEEDEEEEEEEGGGAGGGEGDLIFDVEFPIQQIRSVEHLFDLFDNSGTPLASISSLTQSLSLSLSLSLSYFLPK